LGGSVVSAVEPASVAAPPTTDETFSRPKHAHRGRLFRKYLLLIISLVSVALLASGGIGLYFSYQEHRAALASLHGAAFMLALLLLWWRDHAAVAPWRRRAAA
jgi:hypothetical protein